MAMPPWLFTWQWYFLCCCRQGFGNQVKCSLFAELIIVWYFY